MEYLLIKPVWIELIKDYEWFRLESVPYPENDETPAFLKGAYFVPEFRILQHPKTHILFIGAHESIAYCLSMQEKDLNQLLFQIGLVS